LAIREGFVSLVIESWEPLHTASRCAPPMLVQAMLNHDSVSFQVRLGCYEVNRRPQNKLTQCHRLSIQELETHSLQFCCTSSHG
jgi:hypothetical protein